MKNASKCRCECGYRCGGPGVCAAGMDACLQARDNKHFVVDCGHDFTGPFLWELPDGTTTADEKTARWRNARSGSTTCKHCGMTSLLHAMMVGP